MADSESRSREPIENQWAGVTKWDCPFCPRDSFDCADIEAHIDFAHPEHSPSVTEALAAEQAAPAEAVPASPVSPVSPVATAPPNGPTPAPDESSSDTYEKGE